MTSLTFDINEEIAALEKRYVELEVLRSNPPGPLEEETRQKLRITNLLGDIESKTVLLKLTSAQRSSSTVVVSRPTQQEIDTIKTALTSLNQEISREQNFDQTLKNVTTILEAADTINTVA